MSENPESSGNGAQFVYEQWRKNTYGEPVSITKIKLDTISPNHYMHNSHGIEYIDAAQASMTVDEFKGFLKGNVEKYVWRYRYKDGVKDLEKARVYLSWLIQVCNGEKLTKGN